MLIWDLCGGTGAWSQPYRDAGYCVEVYELANGQDVRLMRRTHAGVWGILCAPPCTVFSHARNRYPATDAELLSALSVVDACLRICYAHRPRWWALENPINHLRRYIGPPRLTFYQWEYGDGGHKPTGIWGDFVPPPKQPKPRRRPSTFGTQYVNARPEDAITPAGFARAFFDANP
jgi:hypothetical protein